jgi:hypothetical protein
MLDLEIPEFTIFRVKLIIDGTNHLINIRTQ